MQLSRTVLFSHSGGQLFSKGGTRPGVERALPTVDQILTATGRVVTSQDTQVVDRVALRANAAKKCN